MCNVQVNILLFQLNMMLTFDLLMFCWHDMLAMIDILENHIFVL